MVECPCLGYSNRIINYLYSMKPLSQRKSPPAKHKLDKIIEMSNQETEVAKYSLLKSRKSNQSSQSSLRDSARNSIVLNSDPEKDCRGWLRRLLCCWTAEARTYEIPKRNLNPRELNREIQKLKKANVKPLLSKSKGRKKTLVLDLDQTLLHSGFKLQSFDFTTKAEKNGKSTSIMTKQRPGLQYFLSEMSKYYQLIIFNSSVEYYSHEVINKIDPKGLVEYRLYREHCITINGICMKNLRLLNRNLTQMVLVDNNANSGLIQPDNLLLLPSFYDSEKDRQLIKIIPFLKYLAAQKEITNVARQRQEYENQLIHIIEDRRIEEESYEPSLETGGKLNQGSEETTQTDI